MNTRKTGTHFEARAESYLTQHGLTAVARNYRLNNGEIDLIMRDGEFWVFVEVKYRANSLTEHPLGQIRYAQVQRIRRAAKVYLYSHGLNEYLTPCRFDVVAITGEPDEVIWLPNAF